MSTSSGPMKLLQRNCTTANDPPDTATAGHTSRRPRQPLITTISHAGTMIDTNGSCRPTIALSAGTGRPVTAASARIGVPMAPNATGAVLAMSDRLPASSAGKPRPTSSAAEIATGVPNPQAPSMNAPNEKAMSSACTRRSPDRCATDCLTTSKVPVWTARSKRKIAQSTIQPMGNSP